jgi:hypothetical protein
MLRSLSRSSRGRAGVGKAPGENQSIGFSGDITNTSDAAPTVLPRMARHAGAVAIEFDIAIASEPIAFRFEQSAALDGPARRRRSGNDGVFDRQRSTQFHFKGRDIP